MVHASLIYAAASCNRGSKMISLSDDGFLIFASDSLIVYLTLFNKSRLEGIRTLLYAQNDSKLCCLEFLYLSTRKKNPVGIISCFSNGEAVIWNFNATAFDVAPVIRFYPGGNGKKIHSFSVIPLEDNFLGAFATDENCIELFTFSLKNERVTAIHSISTAPHFIFAINLHRLKDHRFLLITGGSNSKIEIFYSPNIASPFKLCIILDGHENWVRTLSITSLDSTEDSLVENLLVASGSQDKCIKIWKVSLSSTSFTVNDQATELPLKSYTWNSHNIYMKVNLISVLLGHDDWVYSCYWCNYIDLLSCSADGSLQLWKPHGNTWISTVTFDGSPDSFGFYGAGITKEQCHIVAHTHSGSVLYWNANKNGHWDPPQLLASGHTGIITDLNLDPVTDFILSVGKDSTTRIHAKCMSLSGSQWREIARPQIHGYELETVSWIPSSEHKIPRFISTGDEKVCRVFEATRSFLKLTNAILGAQWDPAMARYASAQVSSLGLTAKQFFKDTCEEALPFTHLAESHLATATLWPEIDRIYGHPNEIFAMSVAPSSQLLATACKSSCPEHSGIRLYFYDTEKAKWSPRLDSPLLGHTLTVTKLIFSKDSKFLLSVSRDRSWMVHDVSIEPAYCVALKKEAHSRIIWQAVFLTLSPFYLKFATISRDKTIRIWRVDLDEKGLGVSQLLLSVEHKLTPPTSVALVDRPSDKDNSSVIVGFENGTTELYNFITDEKDRIQYSFHPIHGVIHSGPITSLLTWKDDRVTFFASAGNDSILRIYELHNLPAVAN